MKKIKEEDGIMMKEKNPSQQADIMKRKVEMSSSRRKRHSITYQSEVIKACNQQNGPNGCRKRNVNMVNNAVTG